MADQEQERVVFSPSLVLESKKVGENEYVLTQIETPAAPSQVVNSGSRKGIEVSIGVITIHGWIDLDNEEIGITPYILGTIKTTEYIFGLNSGFTLDFELVAGRGNLKVGREGNRLVARYGFKSRLSFLGGESSDFVTLWTF